MNCILLGMRDRTGVGLAMGWPGTALVLGMGLALALTCMGCMMAGYSSSGGMFMFPGIGLIVLVLVVLLVLRGRR